MILHGMGAGVRYLLVVFWSLTLLRLASGMPLDWSAEQGSAIFGSLVGHILYGLNSRRRVRHH